MCVILACDEVRPTLDILKDCEKENPHGGGMAWRTAKGVQFAKGLNAEEIHRISLKVELPFVIHFRIATAGGHSPAMCHPFPIGGSVEMRGVVPDVLFHNGHWSDWEDVFLRAVVNGTKRKLPDDAISDTRAIAMMVQWYGDGILKLIKGQRFVYFSKDKFLLHGMWQKSGGIEYSNMNWRRGNYGGGGYWWSEEYGHVHGQRQAGVVYNPQTNGYSYRAPNASSVTHGMDANKAATAMVKSAKESAETLKQIPVVGVTEEDLEKVEQELGIGKDGEERVQVGTFGDGQPIYTNGKGV